jgi:ion channel
MYRLTNIPEDVGWQAYSTITYFSFVNLTLTGFGDVVPGPHAGQYRGHHRPIISGPFNECLGLAGRISGC